MLGPGGREYVPTERVRDLEQSGWRVLVPVNPAPGPATHARINAEAVLHLPVPPRDDGDALLRSLPHSEPSVGTPAAEGSFDMDMEC